MNHQLLIYLPFAVMLAAFPVAILVLRRRPQYRERTVWFCLGFIAAGFARDVVATLI